MPAIALILNAFVWGVSWYPFRQMEDQGLHPVWATGLMYALVFAIAGLVLPRAWRAFAAHPALLALGLAAGFTNVGFNWAVTQGDVVRVVLLFYLMPLWNVLLARVFLGERPTAGALGRVGMALVGMAVVLKTPDVGWPVPRSLPDWLGVAAGFSFAVANILLRRLRAAPGDARALAMFGGCALVACITALFGTASGFMPAPPLAASSWWGWAVLLAAAFALGNVCLQYGAARLAASAASVLMLSEVLFASVSSVMLGAAEMRANVWIGGALIVLAAVGAAFARTPTRDDDRLSATPKDMR